MPLQQDAGVGHDAGGNLPDASARRPLPGKSQCVWLSFPRESQFGDYGEWPGRDVLDSGGERLGGVREIYLDRETGRPEWVLVDVDGDDGALRPARRRRGGSATIRVAHTADAIRSAPGIGAESRIDQTEERRLYAHYGLGYSEDDSGSGLPDQTASVPQVDSREETIASAAPPTPTAWGTSDSTTETFDSVQPAEAAAPAAETTPPWRRDESASVPPPAASSTGWGPPETPAAARELDRNARAARLGHARCERAGRCRSWSAAAEPTNDAPPPAEPPSPEEIEAAEIPEPAAATERAFDVDAPREPEGPPTAAPPIEEPVAYAERRGAAAADARRLPAASWPPRTSRSRSLPRRSRPHRTRWSSAASQVPPRPSYSAPPPPPPEPPAGALALVKERPVAIAAAVATVLFLIIRRLR